MECKYLFGAGVADADTRINRYIMECKFVFKPTVFILSLELIDTFWKVNK